MFFNRNRSQDDLTLTEADMTPGIKEKIDDMVKGWGEVTRGLRDAKLDPTEPPLQIVRQADVDYLMKSLKDEGSRIEAEMDQMIADRKRQHQAEIARKDAQIAAINREIENAEAKIQAQADEVNRRGEARAKLLATVGKIEPALDASTLLKDADIRCEVVRRKFGDAAVQDRSEAYIDERFESLEARANVDPFALVVADGIKATGNSLGDLRRGAEEAYQKMVRDLNTAHNTKH